MKTWLWCVCVVLCAGCGPCGGMDPDATPSEMTPGSNMEECSTSSLAECPVMGSAECTTVMFVENATSCEERCSYTQQLSCVGGDGCCPSGCSPFSDSDCIQDAPVCGNGVVEPGEECDGNCPAEDADCDDLNACTVDAVVAGDASMCDATCGAVQITACVDGDGCCAPGCTADQDDDCEQADECSAMSANALAATTVITSYRLASEGVGFDMTGDGEVDNSYGTFIAQTGAAVGFSLEDDARRYAEAIAAGELALLFEYEGLSGLAGPREFGMNVFRGEPVCGSAPKPEGGNVYTRAMPARASRVDDVRLDERGVMQGRSLNQLVLPANLGRLRVDAAFAQARMSASVDRSRSMISGQGVALEQGIVGGYVRLDDLIAGINEAIRECDCEGVQGPLLFGTARDGLQCAEINADVLACKGAQAQACESTISSCAALSSVLLAVADIDSMAPEIPCEPNVSCDSISAAFEFTGAGARVVP